MENRVKHNKSVTSKHPTSPYQRGGPKVKPENQAQIKEMLDGMQIEWQCSLFLFKKLTNISFIPSIRRKGMKGVFGFKSSSGCFGFSFCFFSHFRGFFFFSLHQSLFLTDVCWAVSPTAEVSEYFQLIILQCSSLREHWNVQHLISTFLLYTPYDICFFVFRCQLKLVTPWNSFSFPCSILANLTVLLSVLTQFNLPYSHLVILMFFQC